MLLDTGEEKYHDGVLIGFLNDPIGYICEVINEFEETSNPGSFKELKLLNQ